MRQRNILWQILDVLKKSGKNSGTTVRNNRVA